MPECQNCHTKWTWTDTMKIGFKNSRSCPHCGEKQYVSPKSQQKQLPIYFFPMILLLSANAMFDLSSLVFLSIGALFILIVIVTTPYTIRLTNKQEPLF